jgi:predicted mannosyl-3-phosphoglycerate phosphatase (HAD superfamily)
MEKRAFERIPSNIEVTFLCNNLDYTGTIMNISENGMLINTEEMCSPFDSHFKVHIPFKDQVISVSVNLNRIILSPDSHDGIGVELSEAAPEFVELVKGLKAQVTS